MRSIPSQELTHGDLHAPDSENHDVVNAVPVAGCNAEVQLALGGVAHEMPEPTGESAPRGVIRGESLEENLYSGETFKLMAGYNKTGKIVFTPKAKDDAEPLAALTDYLNTTFPFEVSQQSIIELKNYLGMFVGEAFASFQPRRGGLHGYKISFEIGKTGGLFAYGGQRGTALISLPGSACALITDWNSCYHLFCEVLRGRITRWDGAVDVFEGIPSVDDAVRFYKAGQFNCGGNKASCSQQGNWIEQDGSGRTFYVGKRKNGKLLRVYEKGKQLGDPNSPWVRWELELHNRDRFIPWDVILEPGKFLAASYACMSWVNEIQERIRTIRKSSTISYKHLCHYAKLGYGKLIDVMLQVEGSPEKVIELLKRPGVPSRLQMGESSPSKFITRSDDSEQE
jgi:phage replication initiation protein